MVCLVKFTFRISIRILPVIGFYFLVLCFNIVGYGSIYCIYWKHILYTGSIFVCKKKKK